MIYFIGNAQDAFSYDEVQGLKEKNDALSKENALLKEMVALKDEMARKASELSQSEQSVLRDANIQLTVDKNKLEASLRLSRILTQEYEEETRRLRTTIDSKLLLQKH